MERAETAQLRAEKSEVEQMAEVCRQAAPFLLWATFGVFG